MNRVAGTDPAPLAVVIPTLNECGTLPGLVSDLRELAGLLPAGSLRVVVADGGSSDGTPGIARSLGLGVVRARRGRAAQMNAGARAVLTSAPSAGIINDTSRADCNINDTSTHPFCNINDTSTPGCIINATSRGWLLFLHADSRLPPATRRAIARALRFPPPEGAAHFAFRLRGERVFWRLLEAGQRVRQRLTGLAYGDQGLLIRTDRWQASGGFPELPVMEDVIMVRTLRRTGGLRALPEPVLTSPRRYSAAGPIRGWLRNASLMTLFSLGVSPHRLAAWYPDEERDPSPARTLVVFVKAPVPGRVKTRLAREVGDVRAAEIYRTMGRRVVDGLRHGPWTTRIDFAPRDAVDAVRRWLGPEGLDFRPQAPGDLGERMLEAFRTALSGEPGRPVVLVGTDAPGVDAPLVLEAFRKLERPDGPSVVLGPALDGGYYLIGMNRPCAELFRDIPWSTGEVRTLTHRRAERAGLGVEELRPLRDVDEVADLPDEFRH